MKKLILLCLITYASVAHACPLITETPGQADQFVDSIGVNTHFGFGGSPYNGSANYTAIVLPTFESSGIRHIRDAAYVTNNFQTANQQSLITDMLAYNGTRIGFDLLAITPACSGSFLNETTYPPSGVSTWITAANIDYFEGLNEFNGSSLNCSGNTWPVLLPHFQADWYTNVKASFATTPVIGPSLLFDSSSQITAAAMSIGSLFSSMDYANQHSYPGGNYPSFYINTIYNDTTSMNGNHTCIATETGYHNDTLNPQSDGDQVGVSTLSSGNFYSNLYFEYWNFGCKRTYGYELFDDPSVAKFTPAPPGDAVGTSQANYGLFSSTGTAKAQGTSVSNIISILADPGAPFSPTPLTYVFSNFPSQLHHTLLQKRNGRYYMTVWQEIDNYLTTSPYGDISITPVTTVLQFLNPITTINQYDPVSANTPFHTDSASSITTLTVYDYAIIVEIIP